jgi:maltooligosyltrehalose trehalohydrolase
MTTLMLDKIAQFTNPRQCLGATWVKGEGVYVRLWAPYLKDVSILWGATTRQSLNCDEQGYFTGFSSNARPGDLYFFSAEEKRFPDPASRSQPEGVFGPSAVVEQNYLWSDQNWKGLPFSSWVIYEIHTGTFSESHNFFGIIKDLPRLRDLGITTLEIMPVSQYSGDRNWGYDGVFPYAVQNSYGGPAGFKALINAAHEHNMAVVLDVVYNHIGPEGNVLFSCGPYAQTKCKTPWAEALNFDGEYSNHVRRFFLQTAWQWLTEYHLDGLRLDAVQTIFDTSPIPFLEELSYLKKEAEKATGRPLILIAETDMNDSRLIISSDKNGFGMDAHWADDLHHALHATLTGEKNGYYADYGGIEQIAKIYKNGVAYEGEYSPFRKRCHGRSYQGIEKRRLIVEAQNHDQVGNRMAGDRLSSQINFEKLKFAAACVLLSPFTPLIFMGEELAIESPFLYFVSHTDPDLLALTKKGRVEEWESFGWTGKSPDPTDPNTFYQCILRNKTPQPGQQGEIMQRYYKDLIAWSKKLRLSECYVELKSEYNCIILNYDSVYKIVLSFSESEEYIDLPGEWHPVFQSHLYNTENKNETEGFIPSFSATVLAKQTEHA